MNQGPHKVPANTTLYFELEMIDTKDGPTIDYFSEIDTNGDKKLTSNFPKRYTNT